MLFLSYLCTIIACDFFFNLPVVTIPSLGQVVGLRMRSVSGRSFLAFRGVPYAQPPVGELRFRVSTLTPKLRHTCKFIHGVCLKDPEPVKSWQGRVFDGTKDGPVCISNFALLDVIVGVEDCLTLHIYTHDAKVKVMNFKWGKKRNNLFILQVTNQLKPVIFYIHGGGWYTGSGNSANIGPQYLLDRDIVLVTVNYRLGPLGKHFVQLKTIEHKQVFLFVDSQCGKQVFSPPKMLKLLVITVCWTSPWPYGTFLEIFNSIQIFTE